MSASGKMGCAMARGFSSRRGSSSIQVNNTLTLRAFFHTMKETLRAVFTQ